MAKNNDERVMQLKELAAKKEEWIKEQSKIVKFEPVTNCSIDLDGKRYNLNVLNKEDLTMLMIKINMYAMSASNLGINLEISGYPTSDWMKDINSKLKVIECREKLQKVREKSDELDSLISKEKRTEMKLDDIAAFLEE